MIEQEIKKLAMEALYAREMLNSKECLVANEKGVQLIQCSKEAIPIIEEIIQEIIEPEINKSNSNMSEFLGWREIIGAYMVIGVRENVAKTIHFLKQRSPRLLVEIILCIPIFFRKTKEGYNFGVAPNEEILAFVKDQTNSNFEKVREKANWVIKNMVEFRENNTDSK